MQAVGVPEEVQAELTGGNARRLTGIEPKTFVTEEPNRSTGPTGSPAVPSSTSGPASSRTPARNAEALASMDDGNAEQFARTVRQFSRRRGSG